MARVFTVPSLTEVTNARLGAAILDSVQAAGNAGTARVLSPILTGPRTFEERFPADGPRPPTYVVTTNAGTWIFQTGVQTVGQLADVVIRAGQETVNTQWGMALPSAVDAARATFNLFLTIRPTPAPPWYFYGHSLGGASLAILGLTLKALAPDQPVNLVTYGCPKPGDGELRNNLGRLAWRAWANDDDPTPLVPVDLVALGRFLDALPQAVADRYLRYASGCPCAVLASNGMLLRQHQPPNVSWQILRDVPLRATDRRVEALLSHSLLEYYQRLFFLQESYPRLAANFLPAGPALPPNIAPGQRPIRRPPARQPNIPNAAPPEEQARVQQFLDALANVGGFNPFPPWLGVEPMSNMQIPRQYLPFVSRVQPDLYLVSWMGEALSYFPTQGNAKVFAKRLSAFLRYLSRCSPFNPSLFEAAWPLWVAQAEQTNNGFVPPLVVP